MILCVIINIYNHPQAIYHRFTYFYNIEFHNKDHIFNNWFIYKLPQFSVNYDTNINSDGNNEYILFILLDLLKVYENHNIQEENMSEQMNKIDIHLSNKHLDMKMNFNILQYFQVLEQNYMNNE